MVVQASKPLREFFQDQDAIRAIAAGISRAGKPEVIRATTTGAGSCASNNGPIVTWATDKEIAKEFVETTLKNAWETADDWFVR
ncbi:DNA-damage-inducible protein DinI [Escherichia coli]|nr:DNA-damage-inducible protein DinI [Escherichia coli]